MDDMESASAMKISGCSTDLCPHLISMHIQLNHDARSLDYDALYEIVASRLAKFGFYPFFILLSLTPL
jgi:hypothetical protein